MTHLHYSLFLQLTAAFDHLPLASASDSNSPHAFVDFYVHLGSVCDLVEDWCLSVFRVVSESRGDAIGPIKNYSKDEVLEWVSDWYDRHYENNYPKYHGKGKSQVIHVPPRQTIISPYFTEGAEAWKAFQRFSTSVRPYRNRIVHDIAIGSVIAQPFHLVPRKEKIAGYPTLASVFHAAQDPTLLARDFACRDVQMVTDWNEFLCVLDNLWAQPISDFSTLFYKERNRSLSKEYNIELS